MSHPLGPPSPLPGPRALACGAARARRGEGRWHGPDRHRRASREAPRRAALVSILLLGSVSLVAVSLGSASCGDDAHPIPDGGPRPDAGPRDAATDEAGLDGGNDAAPPRPRDAGPLPCEQPGWFSPHAVRIHEFALSEHGVPGAGLNLDGRSTCAPAPGCSGGVDNQTASLSIDANECPATFNPIEPAGLNYLLDTLLLQGDPPESFLIEARDLIRDEDDSQGTFSLIIQHGQWLANPVCPSDEDVIAGQLRCDYVVDDSYYLPGTCTPLTVLDNARIQGGVLTAGGPGYTVWLVYRTPYYTAGFVLHQARVEATVSWDGEALRLSHGVLAGLVCPHDLATAAADITNADPTCVQDYLPAPDLEAGCSPEADPDALSAAFLFEAGPAHLVGFVRL